MADSRDMLIAEAVHAEDLKHCRIFIGDVDLTSIVDSIPRPEPVTRTINVNRVVPHDLPMRTPLYTHAPDSQAEIVELKKQIVSLESECERLENLSVENILLKVVPGYDGEGLEIYAKSVNEVEDLLSEMGEQLEEWELVVRKYTTIS